jgi:uncharacterized protein (TIGR02246 family)
MRTSLLTAPLAALTLVLSGCGAASNPEVDLAAEEAALRQADEQFAAAASAKDMDALMSFYAPDAVMMMPNAPAVTGVGGIRDMYNQFLPTTSMSWSPAQVIVARAGDMAVTRGSFHMTLQTPAGPVEDRGKYLTVWKKVDGQWKVAFDAGNTDLAAAGH